MSDPAPAGPAPVDLDAVEGDGGVVWSVAPEGLHANLVVLGPGQAIAEHRNDELDVFVVVVAGAATVTVDGVAHELHAVNALVVPRGARRAIRPSGTAGVRYLTVHRRRAGLDVTRPAPPGPAPAAEPGATPGTGSPRGG